MKREHVVQITNGVGTAGITSLSFYGTCKVFLVPKPDVTAAAIAIPRDMDGDNLPDAWEYRVGLASDKRKSDSNGIPDDQEDAERPYPEVLTPGGTISSARQREFGGDATTNRYEYRGFFHQDAGVVKHRRGDPKKRELKMEVDVMEDSSSTAQSGTSYLQSAKDACADISIDLYWLVDQTGLPKQTLQGLSGLTGFHDSSANSSQYQQGQRDLAKPYFLSGSQNFIYKHFIFADADEGLAASAYGRTDPERRWVYVFDGKMRDRYNAGNFSMNPPDQPYVLSVDQCINHWC